MKSLFRSWLAVVVLFAALASAQPRTWHFEAGRIDLRELAKRVAEITGRVVVYGPEFAGEVELAPEDQNMTREEVWEFFLVVLSSRGWSVAVSGGVARVVPLEAMIGEDQPVIALDESPAPSARTITVTIDLVHARADLVARQLAPLAGPEGRVIAVPGQNRLVVVDSEANVDRLREVIRRLDTAGESETILVVRLEHADPEALGNMLRLLLEDFTFDGGAVRRRAGAGALIVVPETGSRSLVLRGARRDVVGAIAVAKKIDALEQPGVFILRLRQGSAEEREKLLRDLMR